MMKYFASLIMLLYYLAGEPFDWVVKVKTALHDQLLLGFFSCSGLNFSENIAVAQLLQLIVN